MGSGRRVIGGSDGCRRPLFSEKGHYPETLVMLLTQHTDLRNKTPLFAEAARRTACPRAAEGVRVRKQNMLNDLKRIGNSYQVPQGQRMRVVSLESQSDDTITPLCFPLIR